MSNKKATKRALLTSILAICLCLVMLIGSTFAWFTDTASTGVNTITSGSLHVAIRNTEDTADLTTLDWVKAANAPEGEKVLWEPGCTYNLTPFVIKNTGSLALKYKLVITGLDGDSELLKVIKFSVAGIEGIADLDKFEGHLTAGEKSDVITVSAHMDEQAGNTYMGMELKGVEIKVYATQDTVEYDSKDNRYDNAAEYPDPEISTTVTVYTAEELKAALTTLTDAGSGNNTVIINEDITLAEGETWEPVKVDGYNGAGVITVEGNGHTISGLNNTLFAGGFAGKSGIVVNNLTLKNVTINDTTSDLGVGAFVSSIDSMEKIELNNCHLIDSTITSTGGARVGGFIGWVAGYDVPGNGPVDTYVTIRNCSVKNCQITAKGSVGAVIGHAGNNPATYQTIENCTIEGCQLNSTDEGGWRVGVVVGTANVGELTINSITETGNTISQTGKTAPEGQSELYGRFVPDETGKLTIDGTEIEA